MRKALVSRDPGMFRVITLEPSSHPLMVRYSQRLRLPGDQSSRACLAKSGFVWRDFCLIAACCTASQLMQLKGLWCEGGGPQVLALGAI